MLLPRTSNELSKVHVGMHQSRRRQKESIDELGSGLRIGLGFREGVGDGIEEHKFGHILKDAWTLKEFDIRIDFAIPDHIRASRPS